MRIVVTDADTASAVGSGDVPVLATPRLLALAEGAAVGAIRPVLEPWQTSVGTSAVVEHMRASPVGVQVTVEAELISADGRRLEFTFRAVHRRPGSADDQDVVIGSGTMERALVDRERFLSQAGG